MAAEDLRDQRIDLDRPDRPPSFRIFLDELALALDVDRRAPDADLSRIEVHVAPLQGAGLASAHAGGGDQDRIGPPRIAFGLAYAGKEGIHFGDCRRVDRPRIDLRQAADV
jgi:hypothetical protein